MSFTNIDIKREYRSFSDNIIKDFYLPFLSNAVSYKRAVGFFSSSALTQISQGITGLVKNGGTIQLIASPRLSDEDINAINKGYEERNNVIEKAILKEINEPKNYFEKERLNLLAHLIASGSLELKIAFTINKNNLGIFHEKMGLIYDADGNQVAFSGSMNESLTAFSDNYESVDVFCSWKTEFEKDKVFDKMIAFESLWNDTEPNVKTIAFPQVAYEKLQSYKLDRINLEIDEEEMRGLMVTESAEKYEVNKPIPTIPADVSFYDYQLEAINGWERNGYKGIFDMATGTGKTFTGLGAIVNLYNHCEGNLAVIIVCPYQHLVEQWVEDIVRFNMKPIIGYSSSTQRDWKSRLKDGVISFNLGVNNHFCFISTNATFSSSFVQEQVNKIKGNVVLMVDEAHNFGAELLSKTLNYKIPYRLALSATLDRHGDTEGTEKLYNYFGEKCIEYTLKEAIENNMLTPYYYYPVVVCLSEEELTEYKDITAKVFKHCSKDKKGKISITETGKMLLIKRARLVAAAQDKITKLSEIMEEYKTASQILVYCGATTLRDPDYTEGVADLEEKRQIDIVANMLGNTFGMRISKFTSEESSAEREELKTAFSEGKHIQALVAIRCLDEGVNIPSIKTAFILASSTNPKEYVQRRGRVLRKYPGKNHAKIYDFITLPVPLEDVINMTDADIRTIRSLASKEITRMKDFASIAENPSVADGLINDITYAYQLKEEGGGKEYDI